MASKPLPDSKTQEERENKEINLINALNPGDRGREVSVRGFCATSPFAGRRGFLATTPLTNCP